MSLLTFPLKLPLLPVHAIVRLAQIIQDEAERQLADPATIRRELEQIEQARASGDVSDEDAAELEKEARRAAAGWPGWTGGRPGNPQARAGSR